LLRRASLIAEIGHVGPSPMGSVTPRCPIVTQLTAAYKKEGAAPLRERCQNFVASARSRAKVQLVGASDASPLRLRLGLRRAPKDSPIFTINKARIAREGQPICEGCPPDTNAITVASPKFEQPTRDTVACRLACNKNAVRDGSISSFRPAFEKLF
jgi:hypothetical protein